MKEGQKKSHLITAASPGRALGSVATARGSCILAMAAVTTISRATGVVCGRPRLSKLV